MKVTLGFAGGWLVGQTNWAEFWSGATAFATVVVPAIVLLIQYFMNRKLNTVAMDLQTVKVHTNSINQSLVNATREAGVASGAAQERERADQALVAKETADRLEAGAKARGATEERERTSQPTTPAAAPAAPAGTAGEAPEEVVVVGVGPDVTKHIAAAVTPKLLSGGHPPAAP